MKRDLLKFNSDERGITGLETAIVLIAFVVVSQVDPIIRTAVRLK